MLLRPLSSEILEAVRAAPRAEALGGAAGGSGAGVWGGWIEGLFFFFFLVVLFCLVLFCLKSVFLLYKEKGIFFLTKRDVKEQRSTTYCYTVSIMLFVLLISPRMKEESTGPSWFVLRRKELCELVLKVSHPSFLGGAKSFTALL